MNFITKTDKGYICNTESGARLEMTTWYEKAKDKHHLVFVNKTLNPTGRQYFSKPMVDEAIEKTGKFVFENRTTEARKLGNWRDRLTEDEKAELATSEKRFYELKDLGLNRKPKTEADLLREKMEAMERQNAELLAKLEELTKKK
jgi:hypothetical protein